MPFEPDAGRLEAILITRPAPPKACGGPLLTDQEAPLRFIPRSRPRFRRSSPRPARSGRRRRSSPGHRSSQSALRRRLSLHHRARSDTSHKKAGSRTACRGNLGRRRGLDIEHGHPGTFGPNVSEISRPMPRPPGHHRDFLSSVKDKSRGARLSLEAWVIPLRHCCQSARRGCRTRRRPFGPRPGARVRVEPVDYLPGALGIWTSATQPGASRLIFELSKITECALSPSKGGPIPADRGDGFGGDVTRCGSAPAASATIRWIWSR